MTLIPWSRVKSWRCIGCGGCCKFTVKITTKEWLNITRVYGYGIIRQTVDGFYLRKTNDGLCPFLLRLSGRWFCGIQYMKPLACKLWPFRILSDEVYLPSAFDPTSLDKRMVSFVLVGVGFAE